MLRGICIKLTN